MSDDDDFMMDDAGDDDDYDFEYEDDGDADDAMDDGENDVENQYYLAKAEKEDDPEKALKDLRKIVDTEIEKGEWQVPLFLSAWHNLTVMNTSSTSFSHRGFKALKQSTKILFLTLHRPEDALATYRELLSYVKTAVTKNTSEKSINNILDYVGGEGKHAAKAPKVSLETLEAFYSATMDALQEAKNDRLSVKCNLKLAKLWQERKEYTRLKSTLKALHQACEPSGSASGTSAEDQTRGSLLLEVYAIEIQMYSELRETKKLKSIYEATLRVRSAIPHPRIMGVIRECGGKMWMAERSWDKASTDFFESFKQYDESGSPQRIQVLKYLVLTYMLMGSDINPFDSQETKPYRENPQIVAMTNLVTAYQHRDIFEAEKIIRNNRSTILDDPFIRTYIDDVLRSLRTQYLIDLLKPYTRLEISFLARVSIQDMAGAKCAAIDIYDLQQLHIEKEEVEEILIELILDGKIKGKVDQLNGRVELERFDNKQADRYNAMTAWSSKLQSISTQIVHKGAAAKFAGPESEMGMAGGQWGVPFDPANFGMKQHEMA
ncbi:hypothetical protein QFC21_003526 [Naganishia friedmannii]|uniref:Uncharacterized protein n=1 Tax=Naganishia friedmannii TaxID=89922 RepID=A0ACC2VPR0_9TREE|nr:hypothetical protein QFC21_003526 [Naganishia friedmannii]